MLYVNLAQSGFTIDPSEFSIQFATKLINANAEMYEKVREKGDTDAPQVSVAEVYKKLPKRG